MRIYVLHKCANSPIQTCIKPINQTITVNDSELMNESTYFNRS